MKSYINKEKITERSPFDSTAQGIKSCIGNNSCRHSEYRDYSIADGYKLNVDIMYSILKYGQKFYEMTGILPKEDMLIYPFWFSCRHTIEIYLKIAIKRTKEICDFKEKDLLSVRYYPIPLHTHINEQSDKALQSHSNKQPDKELHTHSIEKLVNKLKALKDKNSDISKAYDDMKDFDSLVSDYYFDNKGDKFRYTYNTGYKVNLDDKKTVNLSLLYEKFSIMYDELCNFCKRDCENILRVKETMTYTQNLNRKQIEEISKLLPHRDKWDIDEFETLKNNIASDYNVLDDEFSEALNIIQSHREFATNIGLEIKFRDLSENTIKIFCELIVISEEIKEVPLLNQQSTLSGEDDYSEENIEIIESLEAKLEGKEIEFISVATDEEVNILRSFRELADGNIYSEHLDAVFEYFQGIPVDKLSDIQLLYGGGYSNCLKGLEMCRQKTYLEMFDKYLQQLVKA